MIGAGNRCECFYASLSDDIFLNKDQNTIFDLALMNIKLNTELKLKANSMLYNKSRTCTRVGLSSNNNKKKI